ncbi:nitrate/sulfonate/bicarbonate ABC transporter ATP-binding protein [Pseudaminobacter sp. 19-2017]|uniref:Nitrate/sulfonate/bicarbonate ABC transporter ATP-binding protein n=1 Tax=Pseudaminobacter soli (ex Zhang et al. 2022) TaxID=2831468 RepID=A0A942DVT6_9HYPH|nr:nitrate/sulfonate/bicarbonate ABC transporter ATP-binding protein [Pseudaminobacter soli]MBS3648399.1 nitrate/sulfonate/bicarbonate ABC transporter ATP-binding protein [Pseudaminobacter soli]
MPKDAVTPIVEFDKVGMLFASPSGEPLTVLKDVSLSLREGEILGLLGRSGSGKSTLLRLAAGLIRPTAGEVRYRGNPLSGPAEGIAVIFQTFALYPWLTVLENVELGLDALSLPGEEERRRSLAAIDLIGLDGFESAYPRELSGGMRQRVGFARAIVGDPTLLLMDEPFSALDVLTAETLRTDFLDLWMCHELPTRAVLLVTHNIEEAVLMCDRILVLGTNPGHIAAEIPVPLPQPRNRLDPAFQVLVDQIYAMLTARMAQFIRTQSELLTGFARPLPDVSTSRLIGFIEIMHSDHDGRAELADLAAPLGVGMKDLFAIAAALHMLEFAELEDGVIRLTAAGRAFADSDIDDRKRLFSEHLLRFVPLVAHIRQVLEEREDHTAPRERFELELEDHLSEADSESTLRAAIRWGRYAELFAYDDDTRSFEMEDA